MHVLIVILHRPEKPTGVCRYAANLAKCLADKAEVLKVTLVTGMWQEHYFKTAFLLNSDKIEILSIDIKNSSLSRNLWYCFGLPRLVKSLQPSLVHLAFPLPFFRALFPCPVVSTVHDLYPYQFPENFGYKQVIFNRIFFQKCISGSDAITCVSQTTLDSLKHFFPKLSSKQKPISVIYNYVDFDLVKTEIPDFFKHEPHAQFVLCVGQHRKNKNLDLLIKAYAALRRNQSLTDETQLIIVGSLGPETENLQQLVKNLHLDQQVLFPSSISDNQLCWLYRNCILFAIPSSFEGFCIPLVEALYFSCKVLCSNIPIFKEIGAEGCTYFDLSGNPVKNLEASALETLTNKNTSFPETMTRFTKAEAGSQSIEFYSSLI